MSIPSVPPTSTSNPGSNGDRVSAAPTAGTSPVATQTPLSPQGSSLPQSSPQSSPQGGQHGSTSPSVLHPPGSPNRNGTGPGSSPPSKGKHRSFLRRRWGVLALGAIIVAGVGLFLFFNLAKAQTYTGPTATVQKKRLKVTIVERGAVESAENSDIVCRVKVSGKGSTISTTIKWVIPDGTPVYPGQKLVELDDSALQDQRIEQVNKVTEAKAAMIEKQENLRITKSQNFSDIETAKTVKVLAEIDLRKYLGTRASIQILKITDPTLLQKYLEKELGSDLEEEEKIADAKAVSEYVKKRQEIEGKLEIARSDFEMWKERSDWSQRMVKRGLLTRSQADSDRFRKESADINMRAIKAELDILHQFNLERDVTDLWSKLLEADRALDRVKIQANAKEIQAKSDMETKTLLYHQEMSKLRDIDLEIEKCTIYSPQTGMVVYYVPESSRFGSSSQQNLIQEGEPVRDGQKLMRIPNLDRMEVNTRVHEAMVSRIRGEKYRTRGVAEAIFVGGLVTQPDLIGMGSAVAYDVEMRDADRARDQEMVFGGMKAWVKIDAFSSKHYKGHVRKVATVASQTDFISSEVKVYQTMVAIDDPVENLKPGMSAEVTIEADQTQDEVLTIPIQAVVGTITMGAQRKVFVVGENGRTTERDIEVGLGNDKEVEVKSGLKEGDRVALNPGTLLSDKSDLKAAIPGKARGGAGAGGGKKDGKKVDSGQPTGETTPPAEPRIGAAPGGSVNPAGDHLKK